MQSDAERRPTAQDPASHLSTVRLIARAMRVHQWVKNFLIFVPTVLAFRFLDPQPVAASVLAFVSFSLGASAVYVLNDLFDLEADRRHVRKRQRPFAAGSLSPRVGHVLIPLLLALSFSIALLLPRNFMVLLLSYFVITTLYSLRLKEVVLVDILVLAGLYTLRIGAGGAASEVPVSEWLLAFSMFIFLSLAAAKRYAELLRFRATGPEIASTTVARRGYVAGDTELVMQMGLSSGYIAVLVLALYITGHNVATLYARPGVLWFACPLLLFWVSRIWLLAHRGVMQDDPLEFSVRDRVTWAVAALGAAVLLISHGVTLAR